MLEQGPGARAMLLRGADFDLRRQAFLGVFWGLGDASGRRHSVVRPYWAALPPQRAAAQVSGAQSTHQARGGPSNTILC
jgi:hypothetical protein